MMPPTASWPIDFVYLFFYTSHMSGHNKWSKIKRKKEALDSKKSKVFGKHASLIANEVKKAGGDTNAHTVRAAVERAKADSMPQDNIERALDKGKGGGAEMVEVLFEAFGPGGAAIVVSALTDNNNRTSQEVRHIFAKLGYAMGTPGSASWAFIKNAHVYMPTTAIELSDEDGEKLAELVDALEDHDDVQDVFTAADDVGE
jgi:YebC/PmpR family DNA-binding regulatory protein